MQGLGCVNKGPSIQHLSPTRELRILQQPASGTAFAPNLRPKSAQIQADDNCPCRRTRRGELFLEGQRSATVRTSDTAGRQRGATQLSFRYPSAKGRVTNPCRCDHAGLSEACGIGSTKGKCSIQDHPGHPKTLSPAGERLRSRAQEELLELLSVRRIDCPSRIHDPLSEEIAGLWRERPKGILGWQHDQRFCLRLGTF